MTALYLLFILPITLIVIFNTSINIFKINSTKDLLNLILINSIILCSFVLTYTNILDLTIFSLILLLTSVLSYLTSNESTFKLLIISLKSYYLFLLSFIITFSFFEIIFNINIHYLANSTIKFLVIFILSILIYISYEIYFLKELSIDKLNYVFYSTTPISLTIIFSIAVIKNFGFFYILNNSNHSNLISILFLTSTILEICFFTIAIIAVSNTYHLSIYKFNNKILNMQYKIQINTLKQIEAHEHSLRAIKHDLKNHKIVLYNLIKNNNNEDAINYLDSINEVIEDTNFIYTHHKILNALLSNKKDICIKNNIKLHLDIQIPDKLSISSFDLSIIVGNLTDNALEACLKLNDNCPKYIKIKAKVINNNFVFEIVNPFKEQLKIKNNTFLTSKKDSINHGLGLSNVKSTVTKYKGTFYPSHTSEEFNALVIIPLD